MSLDDHRNPNGTYDGVGVMAELTSLPRDQIRAIAEFVKANQKRLDGCAYHEFERTQGVLVAGRHEYTCRHCGGTVDTIRYSWHELGRRARP